MLTYTQIHPYKRPHAHPISINMNEPADFKIDEVVTHAS